MEWGCISGRTTPGVPNSLTRSFLWPACSSSHFCRSHILTEILAHPLPVSLLWIIFSLGPQSHCSLLHRLFHKLAIWTKTFFNCKVGSVSGPRKVGMLLPASRFISILVLPASFYPLLQHSFLFQPSFGKLFSEFLCSLAWYVWAPNKMSESLSEQKVPLQAQVFVSTLRVVLYMLAINFLASNKKRIVWP